MESTIKSHGNRLNLHIVYKAMGLLGNMWNRAKQGVSKVIGAVREPLRKLGQIGVGVARFGIQNHQGLAMLAHGVGEASGNPTLKNIGNAALLGSGVLSGLKVGRDYMNYGPT
jgi:hypothetical protein